MNFVMSNDCERVLAIQENGQFYEFYESHCEDNTNFDHYPRTELVRYGLLPNSKTENLENLIKTQKQTITELEKELNFTKTHIDVLTATIKNLSNDAVNVTNNTHLYGKQSKQEQEALAITQMFNRLRCFGK